MWRDLGHFSSVFVPPCTDDSGSASGPRSTRCRRDGRPSHRLERVRRPRVRMGRGPGPGRWERRPLDYAALAEALADGGSGRVGAGALGDRPAGARQPLAAGRALRRRTRTASTDQAAGGYRPIAPCCRIEDAGKVFDSDFEDPYMLYFRCVVSADLGAVTHVDGSARVQTVSREGNKPLHELLSAFASAHGRGGAVQHLAELQGVRFHQPHVASHAVLRDARPEARMGARDLRFRGRRHLVSADRGLIGHMPAR